MEKEDSQIKKIVAKVLKELQINGDFSLSVTDEVIDVVLETEDSGMVIGYHGEILDSLQLILSLCISKKLETFRRVSIEVGDYKKNRTDWLENMAIQTKQKVLDEQKEMSLPNLRPWERRIVHMYFQDDQDVISESVGEGRERTLVIKPR